MKISSLEPCPFCAREVLSESLDEDILGNVQRHKIRKRKLGKHHV